MKLKLLVVLMALISFSSCKKEETSALELDKSETVVIKGKVTVENGASIPEGSELVIVVANSDYNENATKGDQFFNVSISADGSYSYDLPVKKVTDRNNSSTRIDIVLTPFTDSKGFNYKGSTAATINFLDKEKEVMVEYEISNETPNLQTIFGSIRNNDGIMLPSNLSVSYTSSNGTTFTYTIMAEDYSSDSNANYKLKVIDNKSIDYMELKVSPETYTDTDSGSSYIISSGSSDFTYYSN